MNESTHKPKRDWRNFVIGSAVYVALFCISLIIIEFIIAAMKGRIHLLFE